MVKLPKFKVGDKVIVSRVLWSGRSPKIFSIMHVEVNPFRTKLTDELYAYYINDSLLTWSEYDFTAVASLSVLQKVLIGIDE